MYKKNIIATGRIMKHKKTNLCLIAITNETAGKLGAHFQKDWHIFSVPDVAEAIVLLHSRIIDCIAAGLSENGSVTPEKLSVLMTQFPAIPVVGVIKQSFWGDMISMKGKIRFYQSYGINCRTAAKNVI